MRKKIFGLVLILTLTISLVACTSNTDVPDKDNNKENTQSQVKNIDITKDFNFDNYNLVNNVDFDFDGDEHSSVELYTTAVKDNSGEFILDDGQEWLLVARSSQGSYVLFQDFIQIGSIDFNAFTIDEDYYIVSKSSGTANLNIEEFKYDKDAKVFIQTEKYNAQGNVNMIY